MSGIGRGGRVLAAAALALVGVGVAPSAVAAAPAPPASCSDLRDPIPVSSTDQVSGLLSGTWLRCGDSSAFGPVPAGEVGFQVIGDRWYRVYQQADGTLVRRDGADEEGTVEVIDTSAMNGPGAFQVNVTVLGLGVHIVHPTFYASPDAVRMVHMLGASDYLRWTGAEPVAEPPPTTPSCDRLRDPITVSSSDQVPGLLSGTWLRCGTSSAFGPVGTGEVGFEVVGDRWYRVYEQADGALVRRDGADEEGRVRVLETFQVDVAVLGSGTHIVHPTFFASPDAVRLIHMLGTSDYIRWTGAEPAAEAPPSTPSCDRLRDPITVSSLDQVPGLLSGTWLQCGASSAFGPVAAGEVGFQVIGDRWYRVYEQADGTLVRRDGVGQAGVVEVIDLSPMSGPGAFQVNMTLPGDGVVIAQPTFFASPAAVRMAYGPASDYVRWTGAPPAVVSALPPAPSGSTTAATGALPPTGRATYLVGPATAGVALGALLLLAARRQRAAARDVVAGTQ